ncbi:MAG: DUF58 domain-containing protein [Pseudomonadales bacterium]|nr:DUF58 domain-containing protein [Pseudomonadales bacterium]
MRPSATLLKILSVWTLLGLGIGLSQFFRATENFHEQWSYFWWIGSGVILLLLIVDGFNYLRFSGIEVKRSVSDSLALGSWTNVALEITHPFEKTTPITLADHPPPGCSVDQAEWQTELTPDQGTRTHYKIQPNQRGDLTFAGVDMLYPSYLGLWQFRRFKPVQSTVKVFPNYAAMTQFSMFNLSQRAHQMGIRQQHKRGEGLEFHQLREFRQGDSLRQINWNSSAKMRKLISKDYQEETNQEIVFLLDCGRKMRSQDGELSHFDHALNGMLLMAYVALKQGDSIGCMSFSGSQRWLPPLKSVTHMPKLLNHVYDLEASTSASDYLSAAENILTRQKKRSLMVLITNLRDENTDDILPALRLLQKKHLVMVASLEEPFLMDVVKQEVTSFDEALAYTGTTEYLEKRQGLTNQLNKQGVITANSLPRDLAATLVNKYLEVKKEGLL